MKQRYQAALFIDKNALLAEENALLTDTEAPLTETEAPLTEKDALLTEEDALLADRVRADDDERVGVLVQEIRRRVYRKPDDVILRWKRVAGITVTATVTQQIGRAHV